MDSMNRRDMFGALAAMATLGMSGMMTVADAQAPGAEDLSQSRVFRFSQMVEKKSANGGWSRAVVKGTLPTGEFVECHETMLPPGQMPHPPHKHPNSEFILLREGTIQHIGEDGPEPQPLGPGDVIFNGSNRLHGMKNVGTTSATYFVVSVSKQLTS